MTEPETRCALHANPAEGVCSRCGRFACAACIAESDPLRCTECHQARWGELTRGPFTLNAVFGDGVQLAFKNIGLLVALSLIAGILETGLEVNRPTDTRAPLFLNIGVSLLISAFTSTVVLVSIRNSVLGYGSDDVMRESLGRFGSVLWATLSYNVVSLLGLLFFVYPGVRMFCAYSLCQCVAALEPTKPPLRTSGELLEGHLLEMLVILLVVTFASSTISAATSAIVTVLQQRGHETWQVTLFGRTATTLFSLGSDALLFCAYVRLRFGLASKPP
jgi:hypothetical protein